MIDPAIPRVALVTGGARRIGRALVLALADAGFSVAIHCRDSRDEANALLAAIHGRGFVVTGDLAHEDVVLRIHAEAVSALGPIGVLVNNAAVFERDEWDDATRESWDRHLETNLRAPFVLSQVMAKGLPDGARGMILNLLDQRVWRPTPHFVSYTVAKSALWTLTQTLALALAPRIRVNAIGPGPVVPSPGQSDEQFARMAQRTPLCAATAPEDIGRAAIALLSLPTVTGQMLALDGGQHLNWSPSRP
ncbi:SDR family oxidoreductase [Tanticharoenia sakaeratensis]|uniref:Short-chain dehydrogenase n=1 Tax=Tanticharoenia sakaeratensis NBRC 103193 TaxID=1231623 RepID=A0A0D6MHP2_9PROT|nr:SDR family oxidoreductase [Tanticharoenia sakaeratensis]GAN53021.1 short-chain dehydrogenase [Tanticharoenia sakaeratensis NBRC 103193]GBQ19753.1 short chain dehydrogenase [Tanticharoenia sakaeratensis NBRC 103193]